MVGVSLATRMRERLEIEAQGGRYRLSKDLQGMGGQAGQWIGEARAVSPGGGLRELVLTLRKRMTEANDQGCARHSWEMARPRRVRSAHPLQSPSPSLGCMSYRQAALGSRLDRSADRRPGDGAVLARDGITVSSKHVKGTIPAIHFLDCNKWDVQGLGGAAQPVGTESGAFWGRARGGLLRLVRALLRLRRGS
jgi:hypothetical protein